MEKITGMEKITVRVEENNIVGYFYGPDPQPAEKKPLLILCHGIPRGEAPPAEKQESEIADGGYPALAESCLAAGFPCFHFNFRGTGESGGNFDLAGWVRDLGAILDYWEKGGLYKRFYLWGFSAGGAVSACAAAQDARVSAVALAASPAEFVSIFTKPDLEGIIARLRSGGIIRDAAFPEDPLSWLAGIHAVNPLAFVARIAPRPLFIVHGTGDDVVPIEHAHRLYVGAGEPKELLVLPGAAHQLRKNPEAVAACLEWFKKLA